ncbi:MAG: tetratricopeptide repeat protein [Clostridia bacterium]|nr:tetratricopeptide repeat protein [Clostridia bacterium]
METAEAEKNYEVIRIGALVTDIKDAKASDSDEGFCFVIGAGASVPSGIPSGKQLVDRWEKEIAERCGNDELDRWKADKGITEENKYSYYSDYYEKRYKQPRDGYKFLEKIMMDKSPSMGYVALSHIMCESKNNIVITTNFDHLIEDAVNYYQNKFPLVIGHEAVAHYIATAGKRPTIIKIHHDLLMDPKNNKASINELAEEWREPLSDIFKRNHPVFVGYAGNDRSLMDFLNDNAEKFQSGEWLTPYWLFYTGSGSMELSDTAREFLNNAGGYRVNYANFDMAMMFLAQPFVFNTNNVRKKIREDAKKKDDMMAQAAEQFEKMNREPGGWDDNVPTIGVLPKADAEGKPDEGTASEDGDDDELRDKYMEAVMYYNNGEYESARKIIENLVELAPDNAEYHYGLGCTLDDLGRHEEALIEEQRAVELAPDYAEYHNGLALTLGKLGLHEEALPERQKALELAPDNAEYHYGLSCTLDELERYEESAEACKKAVELAPDNAKYHNGLGYTLDKLGRYDEALAEAEKAVELAPDNDEYRQYRDGLIEKINSGAAESDEEAEAETGSDNNAETVDQAETEAYENNALEVENAAPSENYPSEPEHEADTAAVENRGFEPFANDAPTVETSSEYEDDAYREETPSEREEAVREAEPVSEREDDFSEAAEAAAAPEAVSGHTDEPLPHGVKADAQLDGFSDEFYRAQTVVDLEPDNAEHHYNLAVVLGKLGFHKKALKEYKQAIMLSPRIAKYHNAIGITLEKLGRSEIALKAVQRAAELEPDNAEYNYGLSLVLRKLSQPQDALAAARAAVVLAPENAKYHCGLSVILAELDDIRGAKDEAEKAVELKPNDREYVRWLESLEYKLDAE